MTTALILAGGRSTRFESGDKAVVTVGGKPLIRHVADGLQRSCDRLLVSCRPDQQASLCEALAGYPHPTEFVIDNREIGPLGGIADGLEESSSPWTLVVGCDFPRIDDDLLATLEPAPQTDAAVFEVDGISQPLCGRYRTLPAAAVAATLIAAGTRRARQLPRVLRTTHISESAVAVDLSKRLQNVNTTAELAAFADDIAK